MINELMKNTLLKITNNSASKTNKILEILENKSIEFKKALIKVLDAEINK